MVTSKDDVLDLHDTVEVEDLLRRMLISSGADGENAEIVARHLTLASLSGVDTHGVRQISGYVASIRNGEIDPRAKPSLRHETPASAQVRGHWGFGQVAALRATEVGIDKARATGTAVIALVECGHIGRVGHYVEIAAANDVVALTFAGGYGVEVPVSVAFGGRDRVLHSNPIAFAFPDRDGIGPMFDFATTTVAGLKVAEAQRLGRRLPAGSLVDVAGRPTDDPAAFFEGGSHVPFGSHKGYAISVMAEWLGRIATGADDFAESSPAAPVMRHQGVLTIFMRHDLFTGSDRIAERSREMADRIRSGTPADGVGHVQLPGDPEREARAIRMRDGIPIDQPTWQAITALARELGVDPQ